MDSSELEIRRRLKNDFIHYATKCLRIRTKSGDIESFVLNKAQAHIHSEIEKQKGQHGSFGSEHLLA